jgi:hypothetical protein
VCSETLEYARRNKFDEGGLIKKIVWPHVTVSLHHGDKMVDIELDVTQNVPQNAEKKYALSKKMREKIKGAEKALQETAKKIESIPRMETKKSPKKPYQRNFWFEKYRWFISSSGNLVIGGRDASSNEEVVKKYLKTGERYVHADIHGAPSCIVKNHDVNGTVIGISTEVLKEACQFALSNSRTWNTYRSGAAYWVTSEQVSKTPETGEYLPKGSFVIRGKRNYIKSDLEVGIGMIMVKDIEKIMGGPSAAIKKRASKYIILIPGDTKKNELSQDIAQKFSVSTEEIMRALPPGNAQIIEEHL